MHRRLPASAALRRQLASRHIAKLDLWRRIVEKQRLINAQLPPAEAGVMGIKYYCFGGAPVAASTVAATAP